jgi:hypothetical protein
MSYFTALSGIPASLKDATYGTKIYPMQVPDTDIPMPWFVIEYFPGPRNSISATKVEETGDIRLTVDVGPAQLKTGTDIIEWGRNAIDHYRGKLYNTLDIYVNCDGIGPRPKIGGSYEYVVSGKVRYLETYTTPS